MILLLQVGGLLFPLYGSKNSLELTAYDRGHILFLLQQGEQEQALKIYHNKFQASGQYDFEFLHQIGLKILDFGFRQQDPECQLFALFGASVSAHEDAYYILEEGIKSPHPAIQWVALNALAHFQNDRADQAIMRALGSPLIEVRYEAVQHLCKKKHPLAASQAESLMYKTPRAYMAIYPPLFAMLGDPHSTRVLRKLLNQPSQEVRLAILLSIAKYRRDDLLPQVRQQSLQSHFALQEACAYAFGELKDEESIPKLEKLSLSQYPTVALAAHIALYQLGRKEAIKAIEEAAKKEDLFAIAALGALSDSPKVLLELLESSNLQVHLNALIALLKQHHPLTLEQMKEVFIPDKRDLAFTVLQSPGHTLKAWKIIPSASQLLKSDMRAYIEHLELKESLLGSISAIYPTHFIALSHHIFSNKQNDLVPHTVTLLENLANEEAIKCLKQHQQQLGAPLVRHYCNLALYRLHEPGPYAEQLRQWVKMQSQTQLIQFKPIIPWKIRESLHQLTPEETSKLLIEAFEAFATQQDILGIEVLIEALTIGHIKNKYALAGLLLRATQ